MPRSQGLPGTYTRCDTAGASSTNSCPVHTYDSRVHVFVFTTEKSVSSLTSLDRPIPNLASCVTCISRVIPTLHVKGMQAGGGCYLPERQRTGRYFHIGIDYGFRGTCLQPHIIHHVHVKKIKRGAKVKQVPRLPFPRELFQYC